MKRRSLLSLGVGWPLAAAPQSTRWPQRAVRVVIPSVPGGPLDHAARITADKLAARLGQPFVVLNRPGAGGTIASNFALENAADDHLLLLTLSPLVLVGSLLFKAARRDPLSAFTPVGGLGRVSPFLVVDPRQPVRDLDEFVRSARTQPERVPFGVGPQGGPVHLPLLLLERATRAKWLHIPYKDAALAVPDVVTGQLAATFAYATGAVPLIGAAKLRAIAYAGRQRNRAVPQIPTFVESGIATMTFDVDTVVLAPRSLHAIAFERLADELSQLQRDPEIVAQNESVGGDFLTESPAELSRSMARDAVVYRTLVLDLGLGTDRP
jgi:tripartite-type tricarboxylate transporter receptor subunit TctC